MKRSTTRRIVLAVVVVGIAALVGAVFAARNLATSQEGTGVVDFANITTVPFTGYPTDVAVNYPPDLSKLPTCQAPADEKPEPELPPRSCRHTGGEPAIGAISTPAPGEIPDSAELAGLAPEGWTVLDNRLFRYSVAIPPVWQSNMGPEGGQFSVYDPIATEESAKGSNPPGGVVLTFVAREQVVPRDPDGLLPQAEKRLLNANAEIAGLPAAIWDEGPGEGMASFIHAVFARNGILYEIRMNVADDGRTPPSIEADRLTADQIIATIATY